MSLWRKNNYAAAAFLSVDICYVVILCRRKSQIMFTTLNKLLWPIWNAACVPASTHNTDIQFALASQEVVDELGVKPEDSHFSSLTGWTGAWRCIPLQVPRMGCCRINRGKLSVFHFLLGHHKTERQPLEKDNITDITFGGGAETRAGN